MICRNRAKAFEMRGEYGAQAECWESQKEEPGFLLAPISSMRGILRPLSTSLSERSQKIVTEKDLSAL